MEYTIYKIRNSAYTIRLISDAYTVCRLLPLNEYLTYYTNGRETIDYIDDEYWLRLASHETLQEAIQFIKSLIGEADAQEIIVK